MVDFQVGRTKWDVLAHSAHKVKTALVLVGVLVALYLGSRYMDMATIEAFVIGMLLGWVLTSYLVQPVGRFVLVVPEDISKVRLLWIPEEHFSQYDSPDSPTCVTSFLGYPLYIANKFDQDKKEIAYGWIHADSPIRVAADRANYLRWYREAEAAMIDNLRLRQYPMIHAALLAKDPVKELTAWLGKHAGFDVETFDARFRSDVLNEAYEQSVESRPAPLLPPEEGAGRKEGGHE
jgi:hypothetical protein